MSICSISDCFNQVSHVGLCNRHYYAEYRKKNKNILLLKRAEYRKKNKDKIAKYQKKYRILNPEVDRNKDRKRRALKKQNGYKKYTEGEVLQKYGSTCYLCKIPIDLEATRQIGKIGWEYGLHIEHVIDIALGGPDTIENVRPSHGVCNLTKKPRAMV